jgi:hypothetical protein
MRKKCRKDEKWGPGKECLAHKLEKKDVGKESRK